MFPGDLALLTPVHDGGRIGISNLQGPIGGFA